jgi:hypothetical protein
VVWIVDDALDLSKDGGVDGQGGKQAKDSGKQTDNGCES